MEKAPDKIYCGNNGHGNLSYSTEKIYPSMEEYIRKDALLEWAKGLYEKTMTFVSGDIERDNEIQMFALRISKHIESL